MDETTLTLHPLLRRCWMKRGRQRRIPAAGQQKLHHLFAAYNYLTQEVIWTDAERKQTASFVHFLEHFMTRVDPTTPVVLVLDNASYPHSQAAEAMLAFYEDKGLIACWLPPYCSDLNPIERFWAHLKAFACANKLFAAVSELVDSARPCLLMQNDLACPDRFLFLNT
jgi:putative transposase